MNHLVRFLNRALVSFLCLAIVILVLAYNEFFHILFCIFVSDIFELGCSIHTCICNQDWHSSRMVKISYIIDLIID